MDQLYNPDLMSEAEMRQTFVGRQGLVDELMALIDRQPEGAGVQHVAIVAPRGMGKTTVLRMVQLAMEERGIPQRWHAVRFPEESYGIYDLADLWIEVFLRLSPEPNAPAPPERIEQLRTDYPASDDLEEAVLALIKDWCRREGKRLVLLVDNLDIILEQINSERQNARLRSVLMNDGCMMILGGATAFFQEARAYDQPLYNFFRIYHLDRLKSDDVTALLRRRAALDGVAGFEETLQRNASRLRVLEYFTGGNPRLVLMLYRIVAQSDLVEVQRGLGQLLDQMTPYYKAKVESLPPQQRKILDHIARLSSETHEGLTPTEIAGPTRLTPAAVSSQLKRLSELGYVRSANLRGRNSYYTLSEPLYALWHQMRFGRDGRQRMQWLVNFLKSWYDVEEALREGNRLETRFHELLAEGMLEQARAMLEHRRYLAEALGDAEMKWQSLDHIMRDCVEVRDFSILRDALEDVPLERLPAGLFDTLRESGSARPGDVPSLLDCMAVIERKTEAAEKELAAAQKEMAALDALIRLADRITDALVLLKAGQPDAALQRCDDALGSAPDSHELWWVRGLALCFLQRYEEALGCLDRSLALMGPDPGKVVPPARVYSLRFDIGIAWGRPDVANLAWQQWAGAYECSSVSATVVLGSLLGAVRAGYLDLVRELTAASPLSGALFPAARALEYIDTGDEALLEKLSPEIRGIVNEIVVRLREAGGPAPAAGGPPKAAKRTASSPNRTRKRLQ